MNNRREIRSETPLQALSLFLRERRRRLGAEALVVATDEGLMLSGEGEGDLPLLAAAGALESIGQNGRGFLPELYGPMSHASILVDGTRVVITTLGAEHSEAVSAGVLRILRAA